jgi:hypothetical protein
MGTSGHSQRIRAAKQPKFLLSLFHRGAIFTQKISLLPDVAVFSLHEDNYIFSAYCFLEEKYYVFFLTNLSRYSDL